MKTAQCTCGYVACGETGDELLADVEAHIRAVHRDMQPTEGGHDEGEARDTGDD